jgi:hypothetical protein
VTSIADAGEPPENGSTNAPASPSVPVRFCTAAEEILRLSEPRPAALSKARSPKPAASPKSEHPKSRD